MRGTKNKFINMIAVLFVSVLLLMGCSGSDVTLEAENGTEISISAEDSVKLSKNDDTEIKISLDDGEVVGTLITSEEADSLRGQYRNAASYIRINLDSMFSSSVNTDENAFDTSGFGYTVSVGDTQSAVHVIPVDTVSYLYLTGDSFDILYQAEDGIRISVIASGNPDVDDFAANIEANGVDESSTYNDLDIPEAENEEQAIENNLEEYEDEFEDEVESETEESDNINKSHAMLSE